MLGHALARIAPLPYGHDTVKCSLMLAHARTSTQCLHRNGVAPAMHLDLARPCLLCGGNKAHRAPCSLSTSWHVQTDANRRLSLAQHGQPL
eukprot:scaffold343_cov584-Prasinococcus_capsulatus_cf.AAC.9